MFRADISVNLYFRIYESFNLSGSFQYSKHLNKTNKGKSVVSLDNKDQAETVKGLKPDGDLTKIVKHSMRYIRHRGIYSSVMFFFNSLREWIWFASHRKTSANLMNLNCIEKDLHNQKHATYYVPSPIIPFCQMMKKLSLPKPSVFVDYGAGKGRAMILAAECGFQKVKGLEFSPSLYHSAQEVIQSYSDKTGKNCFELTHCDVLDYQVKKEDNCFYFFHPFKDSILEGCLQNIHASLRENPRSALLIYQINSRENMECITKGGFFKMMKTFVSFGVRFYVYKYSSEPVQ